MNARKFVKSLFLRVKSLFGVWAFIIAIYVLVKSETNQCQDGLLQTKATFIYKDKKSRTSAESSVKSKDECHILPLKRNSCSKLPNFFLHKDSRKDFQDAILNFWHIQKTGGSSMEMCLRNMYKQLNYPSPSKSTASCGGLSKILDDVTFVTNTTYKPVIQGHYSLGACDFIRQEITDRKCSAYTIFREPYERAVSHYFFNRQIAHKIPSLRDALELPINEWLKKFGSIVWRSFHFAHWTVTERQDGTKKCTQHRLIRTMKGNWPQNETIMNDLLNNLDTKLSFIGLFEDRPTTYKMLQEIYHLPFYDVCENLHRKKGSYEGLNEISKTQLKKEAMEILLKDKELQELMKFDVKIYEKAKEIFYAQTMEFEKMKR